MWCVRMRLKLETSSGNLTQKTSHMSNIPYHFLNGFELISKMTSGDSQLVEICRSTEKSHVCNLYITPQHKLLLYITPQHKLLYITPQHKLLLTIPDTVSFSADFIFDLEQTGKVERERERDCDLTCNITGTLETHVIPFISHQWHLQRTLHRHIHCSVTFTIMLYQQQTHWCHIFTTVIFAVHSHSQHNQIHCSHVQCTVIFTFQFTA